jgi:hypothetical protein
MRQGFGIRQRFWMRQVYNIRQRFWIRQVFSIRQLDALIFLYIVCGAHILYIFLHSYLVCANNIIGANILRFVG